MTQAKARQELQFSTIKDRSDLDYIPAKSRDKRLIELLSGTPRGYRIGWQQRLATEASAASVNLLIEHNDIATLRSLSDILALTALGSAYHTFGEPEADDLAYRRIKIAKMVDAKTKTRTTTDDLVESVQLGFADVAAQAAIIEERMTERRMVDKDNDRLGRMLATAGLMAAALHDGIDRQQGSEVDLQHASWLSARAASRRALGISDSIGTRLTMAQFADDQSPQMRHINDNPWLLPAPAYEVMMAEIDAATAAAYERDENSRMLFS